MFLFSGSVARRGNVAAAKKEDVPRLKITALRNTNPDSQFPDDPFTAILSYMEASTYATVRHFGQFSRRTSTAKSLLKP